MAAGYVGGVLGALSACVLATSALAAPSSAPPPDDDTTLQWTDGAGPCTNLPDDVNLIVPHDGGVGITNSSGVGVLVEAVGDGAGAAVRGPDGTVWAAAIEAGERGLYRVGRNGQAERSASGEVHVLSAGWLDGRSAAAVIDFNEPEERQESWGEVLVEFADGQRKQVQDSAASLDGDTRSVAIGAGRLAESRVADLDEVFAYYGTDGVHLDDWFDPTADSVYNAPPLYTWPIPAASGGDVRLSWIEGPDWDGATSQLVEEWELVVADALTGDESLRLDLGDPGSWLLHADFDGRFWVGTFAGDTPNGTAPTPERLLVVDTSASDAVARDAGCRLGLTATIDRFGQPPPEGMTVTTTTAAPAPTTAPTTVEAPAPTVVARPAGEGPLGCDVYTDNSGVYPVRRCDSGPVVIQVQVRLEARDYDVDIDGFFGPLTEDAVIAFQTDAGLGADGLVDPDTWRSLIEGEDPDELGHDLDGNGIVDPWEVGARPADPLAEGDYVGLEFESYGPDWVIISTDGRELVDLRDSGGWMVGDPAEPEPLYAGKYVVGDRGRRHMLWFLRADGQREDGTPLPWVVLDVVDIDEPPAGWDSISSQCDLDGARVHRTVVGVVVPDGEPGVTPTGAWHFDIEGEQIEAIDVSRVLCQVEVP